MIPDRIAEIGHLIRTQDNRITDAPLFIVQEQKRIYGFDPQWADDSEIVWLDGCNDSVEATPEEHAKMEAAWQEDEEEPDGWTRTAYQDEWHFVTACFTEVGCNDYIRLNGHNHRGKLRVFADSSYRNEEFRAVRAFLMGLAGGAL